MYCCKGDKFLKKLWCCVGGSITRLFIVLSTKLTMQISHRKEIRKLTFPALTLRRMANEGLTLETSAFESLYGG